MSLLDRLASARSSGQGLPCSMAQALESMTDEEAAAISSAMDVSVGDPQRLSSRILVQVLADEGYQVGNRSLEKHRRQVCRCFIGTPKT